MLWLQVLCFLSGILVAKLVDLAFASEDVSLLPPLGPRGYRERENAAFVVVARNSETYDIARSIRSVEDRFNRHHGYDWIFLSDVPFDHEFVNVTSSLVSGEARYDHIPHEHWSYPSWIDQERAANVHSSIVKGNKYVDSTDHQHRSRFLSGFFYHHPLLEPYEYYWRVEPGLELWCDIDFDPFMYIRENGKKLSFVITVPESPENIPSLWQSVKQFFKENPKLLARRNARSFVSDDGGKSYNGCHFSSDFQIGNLKWFRSPEYHAYFEHLDRDGGFYHEQWSDAVVHSLAALLLLRASEIHFFNEIGYSHGSHTHCPTDLTLRRKLGCYCDPRKNVDWIESACLPRWYKFRNLTPPYGYEEESRLIVKPNGLSSETLAVKEVPRRLAESAAIPRPQSILQDTTTQISIYTQVDRLKEEL